LGHPVYLQALTVTDTYAELSSVDPEAVFSNYASDVDKVCVGYNTYEYHTEYYIILRSSSPG